ncbi:MAG: hypothetical protein OXH90_05045 [Paracoccaceae bacterium]|nr:hypothetical protein [Paracoccaceae bacterium]MDE2917034.1 hypothetical protein [Paracoccaceae bacterium]
MNKLQPFIIPKSLADLDGPYPDYSLFLEALKENRRSRESIARLWISEGIPYAFKDFPALYEEIRRWLGYKLEISPKQISLTGSARLGFSLHLGKKLGSNSDYDWFVVDENLFSNLDKEFSIWLNDYESNKVAPKNSTEQRFWDENLIVGKRNLHYGFFDTNKVPSYPEYKNVSKINNLMSILVAKIKQNEIEFKPKKSSIRIYKDWCSAIGQISLNLNWISENKSS